jgi:hypothetical protein
MEIINSGRRDHELVISADNSPADCASCAIPKFANCELLLRYRSLPKKLDLDYQLLSGEPKSWRRRKVRILRTPNTANKAFAELILSLCNWFFGFYIVEFDQNGKDRAQ